MSLKTPVAFIIFRRPEKTARVFEAIRAAEPGRLFIIADGPRSDAERAAVDATRAVVAAIDWPCEVTRIYADENMGCKDRCVSGINEVFSQVDRAIILEDDCLPHPDFFRYCEDLLERHADDARVMHIGGDNFHQRNPRFHPDASYYFSRYPHIWGWATWRRAWRFYDADLPRLHDRATQERLKRILAPAELDRWNYLWEQYFMHEIDGWDAQWVYACLMHDGLATVPAANLVTNIGFDAGATHGGTTGYAYASLPAGPLPFPLEHPERVAPDDAADAYISREIFDVNRTVGQRLRWFAKSRFPRLYARLRATR